MSVKSPEELRQALRSSHPTESARLLLGAYLVSGPCRARIVETEAYGGAEDLASHACRGMTPRNRAMFGDAGYAYVYFTYGMHWMFNVVVGEEGFGAAVLIRAAHPLEGVEWMQESRPQARTPKDLLNGPAKLAAAMGIGPQHYGMDLLDHSELRLELGEAARSVLVGTRIGLRKGAGHDLPWRFIDEDFVQWASRPQPTCSPTGAQGTGSGRVHI